MTKACKEKATAAPFDKKNTTVDNGLVLRKDHLVVEPPKCENFLGVKAMMCLWFVVVAAVKVAFVVIVIVF